MLGRCLGDAREMLGRCSGDAREMLELEFNYSVNFKWAALAMIRRSVASIHHDAKNFSPAIKDSHGLHC